MKKKGGLTLKFVVGIVLVGVCITAAVALEGVRVFQEIITKQYNRIAYQAAEVVEGYFSKEDLAAYVSLASRCQAGDVPEKEIAAARQSSRYQEKKALLDNLCRIMKANAVYACVMDIDMLENGGEGIPAQEWNPVSYIIGSGTDGDSSFSLGDQGSIQPAFREKILDSYYSGKSAGGYFISKGKVGYNISAIHPVVQDGVTAAFIVVEKPMSTLRAGIGQFLSRVVVAAGITALLMLVIGVSFLVHAIIRPIKLVASEAEHFVQNGNEISEILRTIQTGDEIQVLSESLMTMETNIQEYIEDLKNVTAEKERINTELRVATQIQADMLPRIFPPFPEREEFALYASMVPAKEVGGDFYDFFLVDEDHLALVIADVSGKGVPAALFMAIAKTLIRNWVLTGDSPGQALGHVNGQLCEGNEAGLFVTVWLAVVQISTGKGIAANAGHEHPVIRRAGGSFELVKYRHSPAVAVMEGICFREHTFELHPGDSLYVYTDGVPEAMNAKEEWFGTDRMLDALNRSPQLSPEGLLQAVKEDVGTFVGDAPQFDDITMLCCAWNDKEG